MQIKTTSYHVISEGTKSVSSFTFKGIVTDYTEYSAMEQRYLKAIPFPMGFNDVVLGCNVMLMGRIESMISKPVPSIPGAVEVEINVVVLGRFVTTTDTQAMINFSV